MGLFKGVYTGRLSGGWAFVVGVRRRDGVFTRGHEHDTNEGTNFTRTHFFFTRGTGF